MRKTINYNHDLTNLIKIIAQNVIIFKKISKNIKKLRVP